MPMTQERKAGIFFAVTVALLLLLIAVILATSQARGVRVTADFDDAQGVVVGDKVILNGIPIGEVTDLTFVDGDGGVNRIRMTLSIAREHHERVQQNAVVYVTNRTLVNVSGQKFIEVLNPQEPAPPIEDGTELKAMNNALELKTWQLQAKIERWAEEATSTAATLAEAARQAYESAVQRFTGGSAGETEVADAEDLEPMGENGVPLTDERIFSTPTPIATPTPTPSGTPTSDGDEGEPTAPGDAPPPAGETATGESAADEALTGETPAGVEPGMEPTGPVADEADSTTDPQRLRGLQEAARVLQEFAQTDEYRVLANRMVELLSQLSSKGPPYVIYQIIRDWEQLKGELEPALRALEEAGRAVLHEELESIMIEIEEQIRMLMETLEAPAEGDPTLTDDAPTTLVHI